jgi:hypothetical protein
MEPLCDPFDPDEIDEEMIATSLEYLATAGAVRHYFDWLKHQQSPGAQKWIALVKKNSLTVPGLGPILKCLLCPIFFILRTTETLFTFFKNH